MTQLVVLDSGVLLRLWDPRHPQHDATVAGISDLRDANTKLLIPTTALIDVLVAAEHDGPNRVRFTRKQIHAAFGTPTSIDYPTTALAARLRASHNIPTLDALVLATANRANVHQIITTNKDLHDIDPHIRVVG